MKHHWSVKLIALILVVVSAAALAVSGLSVAVNLRYGLYGDVELENRILEMTQYNIEEYVYDAAMSAAVGYLREKNTEAGSIERALWVSNYNYTWHDRDIGTEYEYTIYKNGVQLASTKESDVTYVSNQQQAVCVEDGIITNLGSSRKEFPEYPDLTANYVWESYNGKALPDLDSRTVYYELVYTEFDNVYRLERFSDADFDVEIHLTAADLESLSDSVYGITLMKIAYGFREWDILTAILSAVILLVSVVYLCFAAGRKPGSDEIKPSGTNALPLDLFAAAACFACVFPLALGINVVDSTGWTSKMEGLVLQVAAYAACIAVVALAAALFLMALCAQVRIGNGAWFKRTLIGRCWTGFWGWVKKLMNRLLSKFSDKVNVGNLFGMLGSMVKSIYKNLPLVAQWLIAYGVLLAAALWVASTFRYHEGTAFLLVALVGTPIVIYTAHGFGKLRDAAKRMSEGDLDTKINTYQDYLYGNFADFANDLNHLGDTCVDAAMEKMKSERMKSELITNVSHDIKTPLTSIINYVDLLQRAETQEQRKEYLEVLDRQSQRLKKLIEDLMEMSKASSGNINVELAETDVIEAVNQALGEFSDRFANLNLSVVFRQSEQMIPANCDGKLLWRVMSNVLGNVVKYALPGTRVYVDVVQENNKVHLSVKNISRDPLNIPAEELMERFVRGDESRNDQGNGLGLNIAKSLMEVQHGDLSLTVDGDLFKVILTLNAQG